MLMLALASMSASMLVIFSDTSTIAVRKMRNEFWAHNLTNSRKKRVIMDPVELSGALKGSGGRQMYSTCRRVGARAAGGQLWVVATAFSTVDFCYTPKGVLVQPILGLSSTVSTMGTTRPRSSYENTDFPIFGAPLFN